MIQTSSMAQTDRMVQTSNMTQTRTRRSRVSRRTFMSYLMVLVMTVAMMAAITVTGYALEGVPYQEASFDEANGEVIYTGKKAFSCIEVGGGTTSWKDGGWYVVSKDVTIKNRVYVKGTANLILCDGCTLTAKSGIDVSKGKTLNIYAQTNGTGAIKAEGSMYEAGIGSFEPVYKKNREEAGDIIINGGNITAEGGESAAGIGGSDDGGSIIIYGGNINAQGGAYHGAGIGGGYCGRSGSITIYGGTIEARGGSSTDKGGAGIGGGGFGNCDTVKIYGGKIYALGGIHAAGIGCGCDRANGTVIITDGDITAEGRDNAAGIGEGQGDSYYNVDKYGVNVTISGGTVTARSGFNGAGIGSGIYGNGRMTKGVVTISGGKVTATGIGGGAAIGGGYGTNGGKVVISGGEVNAYSGIRSAGIGGGDGGNGGDVTITGGKVSTKGRDGGKGIGGGYSKGGGSLKLGTGVTLYGGDSENPTTEIKADSSGKYARYEYMNAIETPYTITTENVGDVQVSTDKDKACTGEIVNVTAQAEGDYSPSVYLKKTSDGSLLKVLLLKKSDNSYTASFFMPGQDVTVLGAAGSSGDVSKEISGLGTEAISNPTRGNWNKVYFGSQADPIRFNVLQKNETHFGGNTMLLDCDRTIDYRSFDAETNIWSDSSIRTWLNGEFLDSQFTPLERSAIAKSVKPERADGYDGNEEYYGETKVPFVPLDGEQVFFLDLVETTNKNYGFDGDDYSVETRIKDGQPWWLRSSINYLNYKYVFFCYYEFAADYPNTRGVCVSPALNIDMDSVMFTSKPSNGAYKLTLRDKDMTISAGKAVRGAKSMRFTYSLGGADVDKVNRVSVVMTDPAGGWDSVNGTWKDGAKIRCYDAVVGELGSSGSITLPSGYQSTWRIYLVPEQVNEGNKTDLAGKPVEVTDKYLEVNADTNVEHGTISVYPNEAKAGDKVTVTLTPEGSYSTSQFTVKDATGFPWEKTYGAEGHDGVFTGTFTMISSPVIVTTKFGGADSDKSDNTLKVKGKTTTVKYSKVRRKSQTLKASKVIKTLKKGQGKLSYKYVSAKKGKKSFKKYFKINKKSGKVTVKKGLKKGTYKVTVKVRAAGNKKYEPSRWKKVVFKVKVK